MDVLPTKRASDLTLSTSAETCLMPVGPPNRGQSGLLWSVVTHVDAELGSKSGSISARYAEYANRYELAGCAADIINPTDGVARPADVPGRSRKNRA